MAKKILLGALVGGVVVFIVSGIFHMATNLGEFGFKVLTNEDATLSTMRSSIPDSGLYLFPAADVTKGRSAEDQSAYLAKYKAGPTGLLAYSKGGSDLQFGKLLVNQFLFSLIAALFASWILGITASATTYGSRVLIVFLTSLFAGFVYALPYWNWYKFPLDYTVAYVGTWCASWLVAGFAMAAVVKPPRPA